MGSCRNQEILILRFMPAMFAVAWLKQDKLLKLLYVNNQICFIENQHAIDFFGPDTSQPGISDGYLLYNDRLERSLKLQRCCLAQGYDVLLHSWLMHAH